MCCPRACTRSATTAYGIPRGASRRPASGCGCSSTSRRRRAPRAQRATTRRLARPHPTRPKRCAFARAASRAVSYPSAGYIRDRRAAHDHCRARSTPLPTARAPVTPRPAIADRRLRPAGSSCHGTLGPAIRCCHRHHSARRATAAPSCDRRWPPRRPSRRLKTPWQPLRDPPPYRPRSVQRGLYGGCAPHKPVVR